LRAQEPTPDTRHPTHPAEAAETTHKSSSADELAAIDVSWAMGAGAFEPASLDPPSWVAATPMVVRMVPRALVWECVCVCAGGGRGLEGKGEGGKGEEEGEGEGGRGIGRGIGRGRSKTGASAVGVQGAATR
jgi:hypothetical protein